MTLQELAPQILTLTLNEKVQLIQLLAQSLMSPATPEPATNALDESQSALGQVTIDIPLDADEFVPDAWIVSTPGVRSGKPRIGGRRITVAQLKQHG